MPRMLDLIRMGLRGEHPMGTVHGGLLCGEQAVGR